jgi:hypothetical protein
MNLRPIAVLTVCAMFVLAANSLIASTPEPVVGKWRWFNAIVVDIDPDGTFKVGDNLRGQWKKGKDRQYILRWDEGLHEDTLTISSNGQTLKGRNKQRVRVSAERINPFNPTEPLTGTR